MAQIVKVVDGPDTYTTGGFEISVGEYEKIVDCNVEMHPDTILGTTVIPGLKVTKATEKAAVTVQVFTIASDTAATTWSELSNNSTLLANAKFVLSGEAI